MTTATVLVITLAAVALVYVLWVGIPLWMVRRHPDTPPDTTPPRYLRGREHHLREMASR